MIEESAEIKAIEGDILWVETRRKTACGSCRMKNGCGSGILSQYFANKRNRIAIQNNPVVNAGVGDTVILGMSEAVLSKGSFMVYMFPIMGMLLLAVLAGGIGGFENDGMVLLGGGAGFAIGYGLAQKFALAVRLNPDYHPVVLRKHN